MPQARRQNGALGRAYAILVSPQLAIGLLAGVAGLCVLGVTVLRGARAWELIFSTLWFNALLVLLAISAAAAFFTRIWRRKATVVSVGMILFHLCFVCLLGGSAYNGLYFFHGLLRITEGETLPNGRLESYDESQSGRLFDPSRLRGETTLVRMHRDYKVEGQNKRAAYELLVEDGARRERGIIYFTRHLDFEGVRYYPSKEGYSVLVVASDGAGRELYGGHVPLQSLKVNDGYLYATGTAQGPGAIAFPPKPETARVGLQLYYRPSAVTDRAGEVTFELWPTEGHALSAGRRSAPVPIGGSYDAGSFTLSPREIRYWVGMSVRYDPGVPIIVASLIAGFAGMVLTFVGRVRRVAARGRVA